MAVFRKGKVGSEEGGNGGDGKWVKIGPDESVVLVPLVGLDEMISCDRHEFWDVKPAVLVPCIGKGCPACEIGAPARFKAFLPVVTQEGGIQIFSFGIKLYRMLEGVEAELGSLKGKLIKIKRTGEGMKTSYFPFPTGKSRDVSKEEVPDVESMLGPTTRKEIQKLLDENGITGTAADLPETVGISSDVDEEWEA